MWYAVCLSITFNPYGPARIEPSFGMGRANQITYLHLKHQQQPKGYLLQPTTLGPMANFLQCK